MSGIRAKTPRVLGSQRPESSLTAEERFVIARIDGRLSVDDLIDLTGLEPARVEQIVSKLAGEGAIAIEEDTPSVAAPMPLAGSGETASIADFEAALGLSPASVAPKEQVSPPKFPVLRRYTPAAFPAVSAAAIAAAKGEPAEEADNAGDATDELEPVPDEELASDPDPEDDEKRNERVVAERDYRQVYESRWRGRTTDERCAAAKISRGSDLLALCFDADSRVIAAIFENATTGLDHARLIAFHHRTGTGLEVLARRQEWLRDLLVERRLLRNPMSGDVVLGRVMASKRLIPTYKIATDRDIPELTRAKSRGFLRRKWQLATSEERADLLVRTEARCLLLMTGCTFDAKTTAILCGRPINSAMFVQSIAKFSSSPPGLLAHLMKQPFVRKNAAFKKMLLAHPNMPGDVKRSV